MTHIPFDPEFDTPATQSSVSIKPLQLQSSEKFPSGLAFILGLITALVAGSLLANALLIKLLIK